MTDIYLASDYNEPGAGRSDSPYRVRDAAEFDELMRGHAAQEDIRWFFNDGIYETASTREWYAGETNDVESNPGFRFGKHWTAEPVDKDVTVRVDWGAVPDAEITSDPRRAIMSTEARFERTDHTPEECYAAQPRGQAVRGIKFDLGYSRAVDRFRAMGATLDIGAVALAGHEAAIERCPVTNYGALGREAFLFYIQAAYGLYDRNLIAQTDPATHIFDEGVPEQRCSHITESPASGYCEDSDNQVSVRFIAGNVGQRPDGQWQQHWRAYAYQRGSDTKATGSNMVQAHTIYQCLRGTIIKNTSSGAAIGVYGDTYSTRGLEVLLNEFLDCYHGIQFVLQPGGVCPEQYFHENYTIGAQRIESRAENVSLESRGPMTATRYFRNIAVDRSLSVKDDIMRGRDEPSQILRTGSAIIPPPRTSHCPW